MANDINTNSSLQRAADRVRAKRQAEKARAPEEPITLNAPVMTTTRVRARLDHIPDDNALKHLIDQALTALSRGIRWARGSIINLIV